MKKLMALLLAVLLLLPSGIFVSAATVDSSEEERAAAALYHFGLFKGKTPFPDGSPNFDLGASLTREESVTLLVRLLAKENEAMARDWSHIAFEDISSWALPYVGYAFVNGLTNGTSETTFDGSGTVTAAMFITYVLRAMAYTDRNGEDFTWSAPWPLAEQLGLTKPGEYGTHNNDAFTRADAVKIMHRALYIPRKWNDRMIYKVLVDEGVIQP